MCSFSSLETDANHQISLNHHHVTQSIFFWEKSFCFGTRTKKAKRKEIQDTMA